MTLQTSRAFQTKGWFEKSGDIMRHRKIIFIVTLLPLFLLTARIMQSAPYSPNALRDTAQVQSISLTVNNISDAADFNPGDGLCDTNAANAGSQCSLRAAIQEANATVGTDTINFNIPGSGVQTIAPLSALPTVTDAVTIDGYSQPGAAPASNSTSAVILINIQIKAPLEVIANNSRIKGLEIFGQNNSSLQTSSGIYLNGTSNSVIEGNLIEHSSQGIVISNTANNNIIGGTTPAARNVISGNGNFISSFGESGITLSGSGNIIEGNTITGNLVGIIGSGTNTIGGTSAGAGNVISGNKREGIRIIGGTVVIQGNYIGIDATGTISQPNGVDGNMGYHDAGIYIGNMTGGPTTIGGTTAAARNVISGNIGDGILTEFGSAIVQGNYIGTDATGVFAVGNGKNGVAGANTVGGTTLGAGNLIAYNGGAGVLSGPSPILSNSIFYNGGLGINYGGIRANDPGDTDAWQNFPVLTSVTPSGNNVNIVGTLNSAANTTFRLEFFSNTNCDASGYGEGQTLIGSTNVTTNGAGDANFNLSLPAAWPTFITSTATNPANKTSEFSACLFQVTSTTVTNTNDSGPGSLRQAILTSNASVGVLDTITFNIDGSTTITPLSPLPDITDPVIIDGTMRINFPNVPVIELNGSSAGAGADGLHIVAGNTTVKGLNINRFNEDAIELAVKGNNVIQGNFLGIDTIGNIRRGNGYGLYINNTPNNQIGGTTASARNTISANNGEGIILDGSGATGNVIQGNYVGTNVSGITDLGNNWSGIYIYNAPNNIIGGTTGGARNVISGNAHVGGDGLVIDGIGSTGNLVQGNYIGTTAMATYGPLNQGSGVYIYDASNNTIGGTSAGAGNVIGANRYHGIVIDGSAPAATSAALQGSTELEANLATIGRTHTIRSNTHRQTLLDNKLSASAINANGNLVQGNYIGTNAAGNTGLGNGYNGVLIYYANNNTIGGTSPGAGNVIKYNTYAGVIINTGTGDSILANSMFDNRTLPGIDLYPPAGVTLNDVGDVDTGTNGRQNFPVLASATDVGGTIVVNGTLNTKPNASIRIEFFANSFCDESGYGEGETYLGATNATTNGGGNTSFIMTFPTPSNKFITTTATDASNNTSEFSACRKVSVPAAVTKAPALSLPTNGTFTNDTTPIFAWTTVSNATSYELQVATDTQFNNTAFTVSGTTNTQTPNTSLGADHLYYWRVRGLSSAGNGPYSTTGTFTLDTQSPNPPNLLTPADASVTDNNLPNFTWQPVGDAAKYEIRFDTNTPPVTTGIVVTVTHFTPPVPLLVTIYYWQVRSLDAAGNISAWSAPFSVSIISAANSAPIRNYFTAFPIILTWSGLGWATEYEVEVDSTPDFAAPLSYHQGSIPPNTLQVTINSLPSGTYFWHVRAKKPDGTWSAWSVADSFAVLT